MDGSLKNIYAAIVVAVNVFGLMVVGFMIMAIRRKRINRVLYKEKVLAEINTREKERKRIASDLHDELGPLLSSVRLHVNCLQGKDSQDAEIIKKLIQHIDTVLDRLREISNDLMPPALLRKGLVHTIHEFIARLNDIQSIRINFYAPEIVPVSREAKAHLYRIIQEIIHNAVKHAAAETLEISIKISDNKLLLQLSDDGCGFDFKTKVSGPGMGLSNITRRVAVLHGDMHIDTKPGKGTAYTIQIPLQKIERA